MERTNGIEDKDEGEIVEDAGVEFGITEPQTVGSKSVADMNF